MVGSMTFRALRKSMGLSVNQCADWLGVSERNVRRWEDKCQPPHSVMLAMMYRERFGVM